MILWHGDQLLRLLRVKEPMIPIGTSYQLQTKAQGLWQCVKNHGEGDCIALLSGGEAGEGVEVTRIHVDMVKKLYKQSDDRMPDYLERLLKQIRSQKALRARTREAKRRSTLEVST
jgi:hypothetical protein